MKVETDIITSIAVSLIGRAGILMIMYVETYKTDVIVFINNVTLTNHFQYYRVSSLMQTISLGEINGKMSKISIIKYNVLTW
jgi:hypothetical protein